MSHSDRLFLEDASLTLKQKLEDKLIRNKNFNEQDFHDFEVHYKIASEDDQLKFIVYYEYLAQVLQAGSQQLIERVWGDLPMQLDPSQIDQGVLDVTINCGGLGEDESLRQLCVERLANARLWFLMGPLVERLVWLRDATAGNTRNTTVAANIDSVPPLATLQFRKLETCWIACKPDRITVIFTIHVDDEVDVALGRAFCQEFSETNRKPSDSQLPCTFSEPKDPPQEIRDQLSFAPNVGYISLTISDQALRKATEERVHALATPVMTFRNFFDFHLKNAKSYLHSRLRRKINTWQDQMKNARRQKKGQEKRRLVSGKEFNPASR